MASSKRYHGQKRPNSAQVVLSLTKERNEHFHNAIKDLAKITEDNCRMIGRLIVMFEVLKDKGVITDDEINNKFKELDAQREAAARAALDAEREEIVAAQEAKHDDDSKHLEGSDLQPADAGTDESDRGCPRLKVLRPEDD